MQERKYRTIPFSKKELNKITGRNISYKEYHDIGQFLLENVKIKICKLIKDNINSKDYDWIDTLIENTIIIDTSQIFSNFGLVKRLFIEIIQDDDEYGNAIKLSKRSKRYDNLIRRLNPIINHYYRIYVYIYISLTWSSVH